VWSVLLALLVSPILGFLLALAVFWLLKRIVHDKHLYEPPEGEKPPVWWMRGLLILTCTGVSFAHGTNDGQKSIGLIMLTIIGLMPTVFAINQDITPDQLRHLAETMPQAKILIEQRGDDQKRLGAESAAKLQETFGNAKNIDDIPRDQRSAVRNDLNRVAAELHLIGENSKASADERKQAEALDKDLTGAVQYVPWWVRVLSALCLGLGTMIGYKRIVSTLGERIGKQPLVPAQGASAELVAAALIGAAGVTGFPVSTTHVMTAGIAGTMVGARSGVQPAMVRQIVAAWVLTLPATILLSGGLMYLLG
jgi:PiT family inorganic phosphate transporter